MIKIGGSLTFTIDDIEPVSYFTEGWLNRKFWDMVLKGFVPNRVLLVLQIYSCHTKSVNSARICHSDCKRIIKVNISLWVALQ